MEGAVRNGTSVTLIWFSQTTGRNDGNLGNTVLIYKQHSKAAHVDERAAGWRDSDRNLGVQL